MSQENVEVARRAFEAFNRTYADDTPDLYEFLDPEVELVPMSALLMHTRYRGHHGTRQWIEEMKRDWATFEVVPERFLDVGGDRVLAIGSWRAQGRRGGVALDFPQASWFNLTQWKEGRIVRMQTFTDRNEAFRAAGLSE
jgi:ketosteroid isomerase-like protein